MEGLLECEGGGGEERGGIEGGVLLVVEGFINKRVFGEELVNCSV